MHLTDRLAFARRYARVAVADRRQEIGRCIAPAPHRPDPGAWPDDRLTVSWLGHATVLLNVLGTSILTDPVLERRIGLGRGVVKLGPRRLIQPALRKRELPRAGRGPALARPHGPHRPRHPARHPGRACGSSSSRAIAIWSAGSTRSTSSPGARRTRIGDLEVESIETRHWGARMVTDRHRGWGGYLLRKGGRTVLFGGDTAYTDVFVAAPAARPDRSRHPADRRVRPVGRRATPRPRRPGGCSRPSAPTTCSRSTTPPSA